jgi:hypothetical protein
MTPDQVRGAAEQLFGPVLGDENVERIVVREDEDGASERSLLVDVFVVPGTLPIGVEAYLQLRRSLSERLESMGEQRFAYLRVRDEKGETELDGVPDDSRAS